MKFVQSQTKIAKHAIYPYFEGGTFCSNLTSMLGVDLSTLCQGEKGEATRVFTLNKLTSPDHLQVEEMIFLNLGKVEDLTVNDIKSFFGKLAKKLKGDTIVLVEKMRNEKFTSEELAYNLVLGMIYSEYAYSKHGEDNSKDYTINLKAKDDLSVVINDALILGNAINKARDLGNKPSNLMTPDHFVEYCKTLAKDLNVEIDVLEKAKLEELGMGALLGVNLGSTIEAKMVVLKYNGAGDDAFTALVGKGITFDTGGYNLKAAQSMTGMKYDMCGAADVVSTFEVVVRKGLKVNLLAITPLTENMISGTAYKCDDVLTSLSGKTIEVTNTDAEGRIILADALTYAQRLNAKRVIDIATLTGAACAALGAEFTAIFTNSDSFLNEFKLACEKTGEPVWQLPLADAFTKAIRKSKVADIVNSVSIGAGASIGATFLKEFIEPGTEWIHLDVASTSTNDEGATGTMISSMVKWLENVK